MNKCLILVAAAMMAATSLQAQTERSDDFRAKYELKEVVVMSRHNIRSPLTSGGAAYMRVTPYEWFKWTSPSSQLSQRGGVLETEMGQFFRKWVVGAGLLPDNYRPVDDIGNLTNYEKASEYGVKSVDLDKNPHFFIQM